MNTLVRRALQTALVSGGLVVAGASMAHAAQDPAPCPVPGVVDLRVGGTDSLLDLSSVGQVVHAPVHVPVDVSGVAVAVAGDSVVSTVAPTAGTASPSADGGVLAVPVSVPVSVSGVALGVLGEAAVLGGEGGGSAGSASSPSPSPSTDGALVAVPVSVPVSVSGVALGVLGEAAVVGGQGGGSAGSASSPSPDGGVVAVPVSVPVSVSGVALGVLGAATVDRAVRPPDAASPTAPGAVGGTTGPAPGAAGESLVLAANPLPTLTDGAVLADTGWTPWLAVVALGLVVAGLAARRVGRVRPARHLLADRVPTQRGEPSPR